MLQFLRPFQTSEDSDCVGGYWSVDDILRWVVSYLDIQFKRVSLNFCFWILNDITQLSAEHTSPLNVAWFPSLDASSHLREIHATF